MLFSAKHILSDEPNFDTKVNTYEESVRGFFLDVAKSLVSNEDAHLVVLMIIAAYFEGHAIFLEGEDSGGKSKRFFKIGFKAVIQPYWDGTEQALDNAADIIYKQIRCGLFHTGMPHQSVGLHRGPKRWVPFQIFQPENFAGQAFPMIYVPTFLELVEEHFNNYLAKLRDPQNQELRENFEKAFHLRFGFK